MLSSAQLTAFQTASQTSGDESIIVKRAAHTQGATGHYSDAYSTITTVNGNVSKEISSSLLQNYSYLIASEKTWLVRVPVGTNVLENDRLVTGSQTLRVDVVLQPQSYQVSLLLLTSQLSGESI